MNRSTSSRSDPFEPPTSKTLIAEQKNARSRHLTNVSIVAGLQELLQSPIQVRDLLASQGLTCSFAIVAKNFCIIRQLRFDNRLYLTHDKDKYSLDKLAMAGFIHALTF